MKHLILALLAATFSLSATATVPQSGWYFNPNESGRGFAIEIQGNTLFIAGFLYDAAGNPIWFVSGGPMSSDHSYSGAAFQTANGQPLGGSYRAPTAVPFGNAAITFPTSMDANITVNGFNFTVTREIFGFDSSALYVGRWHMTDTPTAANGLCGNKAKIGIVHDDGIVVADRDGNFYRPDLGVGGTITTSGGITLILAGDNNGCSAGSGTGVMTDLNNGSGSWSQGGDAGTFTLSRVQ